MIKIENVNLTFNNEIVLNNVNYTINKGENICFWGSSGSGKTSLLKILNGIITPQTGKVIIDNIELNQESIKNIRTKISWIPQNINLPVNNSEQLIQLLQLNEEQQSDYIDYIHRLGLHKDIVQKSFQKVSGGQKQRIVISAILALKKPILLLDEPTSALDNESVKKLIKLIIEDLNYTVISATHDIQWSEAADKILKL